MGSRHFAGKRKSRGVLKIIPVMGASNVYGRASGMELLFYSESVQPRVKK